MTTTRRHPDPATLMSFAAGSLAEPLSAVMAAHLDMCAACRREIADLELVGGALVSELQTSDEPETIVPLPARPADMPSAADAVRSESGRRPDPSGRLPASIATAFELSFDAIPWKRLGSGVWHHRLPLTQGDMRLLKISPGLVMPDHGHGGGELTLVLDGAYSDVTGTYRRGDMQDVDETIEHTPIADPVAGCVCLIASERPARFKTLVGRLLQPWTGM